MSWTDVTSTAAVRPKPQATPPRRVLRVFIGSVALLLGLFGCSTAPGTGEVDLEAARFRLERRYQVEARAFRAIDETWYDSPWFDPWISDEIKVILRDPERRVMSVSRIFEDVDTNERRTFGPLENCILPVSNASNDVLVAPREAWSCNKAGVPGPFYFTVEVYEADTDFWSIIYGCLSNLGCPFSIPFGYDPDSDDYVAGDELIGKQTLTFSAEELVAALPNVGDTATETITLGPCFDERGCVESPGLPTGPEYTFTYRVTRLPDKRVLGGPTGPVHPIDPAP